MTANKSGMSIILFFDLASIAKAAFVFTATAMFAEDREWGIFSISEYCYSSSLCCTRAITFGST
jgi:hypothetical protein